MTNVVDLVTRRPHVSGSALCLACRHEWVAVAPIGGELLQCPRCGLHRGAFKFPFLHEGALIWICKCGNDLLHITRDGAFCPNCGRWKDGLQEGGEQT